MFQPCKTKVVCERTLPSRCFFAYFYSKSPSTSGLSCKVPAALLHYIDDPWSSLANGARVRWWPRHRPRRGQPPRLSAVDPWSWLQLPRGSAFSTRRTMSMRQPAGVFQTAWTHPVIRWLERQTASERSTVARCETTVTTAVQGKESARRQGVRAECSSFFRRISGQRKASSGHLHFLGVKKSWEQEVMMIFFFQKKVVEEKVTPWNSWFCCTCLGFPFRE